MKESAARRDPEEARIHMATREQGLEGLRVGSRLIAGLTVFQLVFLIAAGLVSAAIGYTGYERLTTKPAPAPVQTAQVQRGQVLATVSSTGSVVATQQAKLTFQTSGRVTTVNVKLGDQVKAGQVLATLDAAPLEIKLATAQSSLRAAQLKQNQATNSVRPEDLAATQAAVDSAQAKYDQVKAGPTNADLKAAQQAVTSAQATLDKAQATLTQLKNAPDPNDVKAAEQDIEKAKSSLWSADVNRDGVCSRGPQYQCDSANASVMSAEIAVQQAKDKLAILQAGSKPEDIAAGQKAVDSAQTALDAAQAKLDDLQAGPKDTDLQTAASALASAKAQLAQKTSNLLPTDQAIYQEQIKSAEIGVQQAQLDLDNAALKAPFDGTVGAIAMNVGEMSASSSITIVDPQRVRIDGTVDETDVSKLKVGQQAQITFDAVPNTTFNGAVIAIAPAAQVTSGVVNYPISVSVDPAGKTLPAGMSATVSVITDRRDNVLTVPNRAIRTVGRNRTVQVQTADGKTEETRTVQVGMSNDQVSEILSGLSEGDVVVIPATTTTAPRVNTGGFGGGGGPVFMGGPGR